MSNRRFTYPLLTVAVWVLVAPHAETTNGDPSFRGNRRPGFLEAPSEVPTGENALLYRRLGKIRPDQLLELLSEMPTDSTAGN